MNVSEGRDLAVLRELDAAGASDLLDRHTDLDHHRSVFTLVGESAPRRIASATITRLTIDGHDGVHPRLGVVDVVPFVPLAGSTMTEALRARDAFARWLVEEHGVPCFLYGPERSLPEVRRDAWRTLAPDLGPSTPHRTAGAACVGARDQLVAYNCWLDTGAVIDDARRIARAVRSAEVRALGLAVGNRVQVSMNLVAPVRVGPLEAERRVSVLAGKLGRTIEHNELVGLLSRAVLARIPRRDWSRLDVNDDRTIEGRLESRG